MNFDPNQDKNVARMYFATIPDSSYYNENHRLIRVRVATNPNRYLDLPLSETIKFPNPQEHYAIITAPEETVKTLSHSFGEDSPRFFLPPGYKEEGVFVDNIPLGFVSLVDRQIVQSTTNPYGVDNLNTRANDISDPKNVKFSISPSLRKPYTTLNKDYQGRDAGEGDLKNENIGIFVTENSVYLKAGGFSLALGPQGATMNGMIEYSNTKSGQAVMQDNPFLGWIPATLVTIPLTIGYIPHVQFMLNMGLTAARLMKSGQAVSEVISSVR